MASVLPTARPSMAMTQQQAEPNIMCMPLCRIVRDMSRPGGGPMLRVCTPSEAPRRGWRRAHGFTWMAVLAMLAGPLSMSSGGSPSARTGTALIPTFSVNPTSGAAGFTVTLVGSGFVGSFAAVTVTWDGTHWGSFSMAGGSFTKSLTTPDSPPGDHTITACSGPLPVGSPCYTGEFEQKASATFRIPSLPPEPSPGRVDYQLIALEVTQAVRGNIPTRTPPDGPTTLPADDAVHVANRHTVVRAYPWVRTFSGGLIRPVTAYLQVQLPDGAWSPRISPTTSLLYPVAGRSLVEMRGNAAQSFNFLLPRQYVRVGTRSIRVMINPGGDRVAPRRVSPTV